MSSYIVNDRDELISLTFEADTFDSVLSSCSLYSVLVSAAAATCYRGRHELSLHETNRASLFQELGKLLYLLRSHSAYPSPSAPVCVFPSAAADDLELQVTAMHVLLAPSSSAPPPNAHVTACQASSLQLLMVVASPDPDTFQRALGTLAARVCGPADCATRRVVYRGKGHTFTAEAPALLVPLLQSLLGLLELLLLEVSSSVRGGLRLLGTNSGTKLVPILVCSVQCSAVQCRVVQLQHLTLRA